MTPVINPWIFYIMPVCENLRFISFCVMFACAIVVGVLSIMYFADLDCNDEDDGKIKQYYIKKLIPIMIITALLTILIPGEETITKMLIAQNVTYERVDVVTDTVANVYNDIMSLFQDSGAANG